MEKNQEFYQNKQNYGDVCVPSRDDIFTHLIKEHFLSEFSTEEDKLQVLENLGLLQKLEQIKQILSNKADLHLLKRYVTEIELARLLQVDRPRDEKSKGYFSSLEELTSKYPTSSIDDWAVVNVDGDWYVFKYTNSGWAQAEPYKTDIDLTEYAKLNDLDGLQTLLISGENIKTINGQSILGEGDIVIEGGGGNQGIDLSEYATKEELYNIQFPLKVKLVLTPTLYEFTGENQTVTLSVVTKKGDTTVVPNLITLKINNEEPITINSAYQTDINRKGITTFEVTCKRGLEEVTATTSVNFVLPTYIGFDVTDDSANLDLSTLSKRIKSNAQFSEAVQNVNAGSYLWIVSPFNVNKVATDEGFTYVVRMINVDYKDGLYYYRSSSAIDVSHLTYYIK